MGRYLDIALAVAKNPIGNNTKAELRSVAVPSLVSPKLDERNERNEESLEAVAIAVTDSQVRQPDRWPMFATAYRRSLAEELLDLGSRLDWPDLAFAPHLSLISGEL